MKRTLLSLLAVAAMTYAVNDASADIVLTFDDILPGRNAAGSTVDTTNIPATFAQTNPDTASDTNLGTSSLTFNWSGLADVDGDGTDDTVTFDILVSSLGNLTTNPAGLWGADPGNGNSQLNSGEEVTFTIANIAATLSDPNSVLTSASAEWFDFTTNGGGDDQAFSIDGGTTIAGADNTVFAFTADQDFTVAGLDTAAGGDSEFRVRAASFRLDLVTASAVPEPSSLAILGLGGLAMLIRRRK